MNVCLITPNVFPVPAVKGGACETLVYTIVKENEKLNRIKLTCVSIYDEKAFEISKQYKNTEFIYIKQKIESEKIDLSFGSKDILFEDYMDKIYEKIKDIDFDYIVIEGGDMSGYKYLLQRFPKEKCIAHLHGNFVGTKELEEPYGYYLAVSNYVAKKLTHNGIITKDRVRVLYNGVELDKFKRKISIEEKQKIRNKYGIKENEKVIMYCGRIDEGKGVKDLILAFKQIKNLKKAKLLVVGSVAFGENTQTEFERELEKISKEIEDRIVFTGFVHNDELYKIHNISDIAVVPSKREEAFGLVVVEAMASGLPLIVTRDGGISEIVDNESAIILELDENLICNITNGLDYLIENPEKGKRMGQHGLELSEKFSNNTFYNEFVDIITELAKI